MSEHIQIARNCFAENLANVDASTDTEKRNLYTGLVALCDALEGMKTDLGFIDAHLPR